MIKMNYLINVGNGVARLVVAFRQAELTFKNPSNSDYAFVAK